MLEVQKFVFIGVVVVTVFYFQSQKTDDEFFRFIRISQVSLLKSCCSQTFSLIDLFVSQQ